MVILPIANATIGNIIKILTFSYRIITLKEKEGVLKMSKHEEDTEEKIDKIKVSIKEIKKKLSKLGIMHTGSINTQYNICGNPNCACKNKENPKKHGPYYQLSYPNKGRSTTKFIKEEELKTIRKQVEIIKNSKR